MNLLLVSVDSLRLDHVARVPGAPVATPRFDAVSAGFAFSDRCFSVSSATRPVHTSLVTGLYPFEHGLRGQQQVRVRAGAPRLFRLFRHAGYRVGLFSEAPTVFTGIDLGAPVVALETTAAAGLEQLRTWLPNDGDDRCLFVHYWGAHTPYGAVDGRALGETARLLRGGRDDVVRARYADAVAELFEDRIAPLLGRLDLGRWAVVLFGDHGESWSPEEPYHGRTVRNAVLRVPLFVHIPLTGNPPLRRDVITLLDLFPTLVRLFRLPGEPVAGYGRDLVVGEGPREPCLAEVVPGRDVDDMRQGADAASAAGGTRWAVFDARWKLMGQDGASDPPRLVDTWTEAAADGADTALAASYRQVRERMLAASPWNDAPWEEAPRAGQEQRVRGRLRALGYL